VHRCAACKVQATEVEDPTGGIPCPASDRVIDDRGPDKGENHARKHTATFSHSTDGKRYTFELSVALSSNGTEMLELNSRNASEHSLEHGEEQIRHLAAANRRRCQHTLESKIR